MIALGADHAGYEYKEKIKDMLKSMGLEFQDFGAASIESTDYPDYAHKVAEAVTSGNAEYGILVCGTGIGMSIVANKHNGVRAGNVESVEAARMARAHNNANVLAIGARLTPWEMAREIIKTFLATTFEGGRHQRRVDKIHSLTNL
ncbi:MAG TPA: ribose 5-phosphate isomerase B [Bacteroidota bacterium]|jgi:ribose 5-phosphate isomerase B|nr:ribose 5-phosphate isomerase B [Bacteroidota bacterium]